MNVNESSKQSKHRGGVKLTTEEIDTLLEETFEDLGHAKTLLRWHKGNYIHTEGLGWLYWTGTHWSSKGANYRVREAVIDTLVARRIAAVKTHKEKAIRDSRPTTAQVESTTKMLAYLSNAIVDEFDNEPDKLNCTNGVIDLRTSKLTRHDPSQKFTYCINCNYDPNADMTLWENHIRNTFIPERYFDPTKSQPEQYSKKELDSYLKLLEYVQLALGYSITGQVSENIMFYIWSGTRAGKGTIFQTLSKLLGKPIAQPASLSTLTRKRDGKDQGFDLAPLRPARLLIVSESDKSSRLNENVIKNLTGEDEINCSFKGKNHFHYFPRFKIWLSSNYDVQGNADDDALWGRLKVIHAPNSYLGREDTRLKSKMLQEKTLEGVLRWLVEGANRWYQEYYNAGKKLFTPEIVKSTTATSRKENDVVGIFIEECCIVHKGGDDRVPSVDLQAAYRNWCLENDYTPKKATSFNKSMKMKGFIKKTMKYQGASKKCWMGIEVKVTTGKSYQLP